MPSSTTKQHPAPPEIHGYLLAGGQSSRMGTDKTTLSLDGHILLDRATTTLTTISTTVTVVGRPHPILRHIPDVAPNIGPVGGVTSALRDLHNRQAAWALFLPVDVPLLPAGLLQSLVSLWLADSHTRVAFPIAHDRPQPVISLIHSSALPAFEHALRVAQHRLRAVLESAASPHAITRTHLTFCEGDTQADGHPLSWDPTPTERHLQPFWFSNCNTPADLAHLKQALRQAKRLTSA